MISVCIPIYNFNVTKLVKELSRQSSILNVSSEIILIDDCSKSSIKKVNESICSNEVYIKLDKNIGRAAIRNKFLNYAKYENLLFLDCDVIINSKSFLKTYIDIIKANNAQIMCGGRTYKAIPPKRDRLLRWKYGVSRESKSHEIRGKSPNKSFMTNNFVITKSTFQQIKFDERLNQYGHEDTLFGFELKKRNIKILHIDNTVLSDGLECNNSYISSTESAVDNLIKILRFINYDKKFIEDVRLLRIYYKYFRLRRLIVVSFIIFKPIIKYFLSKGYVSLYLFEFYKLGTLCVKMKCA
ncbi:glycosyltransferase family 2 protein [Jejuia spongiicola]|uniref:Glycosyltransferase family 2 protein n=1 Tax=Jejuia spongiicola TaxID=2942207 RepID=A0ABT0QC94_9FLAO|nr:MULTISPECIES: glycosyltransferase [Flavobacteriaceae]MCL6294602.1 glycosyltransferase family 2 protein [Jejuia spongiicola]PIA78077.1 hypothetical protein BFR04_07550 [Gaetbulibacter sp. 4G1]